MAAKKQKSPASEFTPSEANVSTGDSQDGGVVVADRSPDANVSPEVTATQDVAGRFIGQWNRLVSTTNWEKGRIICQWREALELASALVTEFSDEAWAQLVGGVTSQHVGRLRRVYQRFGAVFDQYEGLYWSHFQAALDWDDAEMWLEGAILNKWSVSQMRGKRWETLGNPGAPPQDDSEAPFDDAPESPAGEAASAAGRPTQDPASTPPHATPTDDEDSNDEVATADPTANGNFESPAPSPAKSRTRLAVEVDELPEDLADAFEQFKLAIIAQRRLGWSETTPEAVIECLDALKQLTLAPADS